MVKTKCSICKQPINSNIRIEVYARRLGRLRKLEGYHELCWNQLVKKNRQSLSKTKPSAEGSSNSALHDSGSKPSSKSCPCECHTDDSGLYHLGSEYCNKCRGIKGKTS